MNKINHLLDKGRPVVMGILNTTPDSFSDGGRFDTESTALEHARQMIAEGADIIDVGGESTRPGATPVSVQDEIHRVAPVIRAIRAESDICISIDTCKPEVMHAAVDAGADLVNDVNGLQAKGALAACAAMDVPVCVMHMQGEPRTMQDNPQYDDVVRDVTDYLLARATACEAAGIGHNNILLDPGFGFGKTLEQNLLLLKHLHQLCEHDYPVLVGISRKSMLGAILDNQPAERLAGSLSAAVLAWTQGAKLFRVHDVKQTVDALKVCQALARV